MVPAVTDRESFTNRDSRHEDGTLRASFRDSKAVYRNSLNSGRLSESLHSAGISMNYAGSEHEELKAELKQQKRQGNANQ